MCPTAPAAVLGKDGVVGVWHVFSSKSGQASCPWTTSLAILEVYLCLLEDAGRAHAETLAATVLSASLVTASFFTVHAATSREERGLVRHNGGRDIDRARVPARSVTSRAGSVCFHGRRRREGLGVVWKMESPVAHSQPVAGRRGVGGEERGSAGVFGLNFLPGYVSDSSASIECR